MKKILALFAALFMVLAMTFVVPNAVSAAPEKCTEVVTIVDSPASSEVVHHPAVTHEEKVIDSPAVEAVPSQWWNWAPNNSQGPQDYTPDFPVDNPAGEPRGTWIGPHTEGGPDGTGTFNVSHGESGNSSWFHRNPAVEGSPEVSHFETVVDVEAFDETIRHPAVTHDETVAVDCPDTPDTPSDSDNPEDEPNGDTPKTVSHDSPQQSSKPKTVEVPTVIDSGL